MHRPLHSHLFLQPANILLQDWIVPQGWPHHTIQQMPATTTHLFPQPANGTTGLAAHHTADTCYYNTHLFPQPATGTTGLAAHHTADTCYYNTHLFPQPATGTTGLAAHHTADTCYYKYNTHLFLQPVDCPLPLGGGDQQVVLGQTAAVAESHQELDALVRPPTVRHVVQPNHRCNHGKNKATSRKLWRQGVHSCRTCCGQWLDLLQLKKNTQWTTKELSEPQR